MPALVQPSRLIVLGNDPSWVGLLRERLIPLDNAPELICAGSWEDAAELLDDDCLLLCTPAQLPAAGASTVPIVLLLEREPESVPPSVSDWLVFDDTSPATLRRCMRYVAERSLRRRFGELDPLTGIANRQGFQALLTARMGEHDGRDFALGHLDLDNFRAVNDSLGYQAGDRLILQVVERMKDQLGEGDRLARLGSDEFALLIETGEDFRRAERVAAQVVEALEEPYWLEGESLLIGCSLGMAHANGGAIDPLMWHAHIAMQQAKNAQGCTFHLYDERINHSARTRARLEGELRRALRRDELALHYQPRLCLQSGRFLGVEALVRWQHPRRGLLAPSEFVPLAEESGLIVPLGYWVISRALRDMQGMRAKGLPALHMAVNLSFRQFQDSQLLPTLSRLIEENRVDARWLEFELTETAVMRRSDQVRQTMQALRKLGVRFSLDDFGTGFSSFVHLDRLPIALLKIDKSFVGGMNAKAESYRLVRAMIDLAHNLGLEVVAEGVESAEQLALLARFGCDQVQGYLISRPLPLEQLSQLLSSNPRQASPQRPS
ncbi:bifunctional diguanylate cyclase/phosphodiesterase [Pseudomonas sp.]|uniref:putative bifunctional diguanylate cyclase/phosphodiesterase n=1 Tax=Pseudomonas sp. TaxID=306 RepID=UPI0028AA8A85|nr:bifunctional diguanylate cyclase/phosphodiesterase [Pseudomonas sp.]